MTLVPNGSKAMRPSLIKLMLTEYVNCVRIDAAGTPLLENIVYVILITDAAKRRRPNKYNNQI